MINVLDRACKKLTSCPDVDQSALALICEQVAMMPKPPVPTCAAARKCLESIDQLSCSQAQTTSPMSMFTLFSACSEADRPCGKLEPLLAVARNERLHDVLLYLCGRQAIREDPVDRLR